MAWPFAISKRLPVTYTAMVGVEPTLPDAARSVIADFQVKLAKAVSGYHKNWALKLHIVGPELCN
ncbi:MULTISPECIES: hypothetical protein [unclassified Ruegeria]|uniref:hypothetical protein n=1 Tax=unclassified Ruegeria TaxID=2625375 RepID=UPI001AD9AFB7|nr:MULTISPECIES: hypothetical protein [unclassified Ruegeria]MBO9412351.1 hypothetical protein [Ruegeria sp. R8_1]MBO9416411.1 hypothetical protein [Ruegeria sp. R8_2]